jgi:MFS family permease
MNTNEGKFNFFQGITRNVIVLGIVSLFNDVGSQMVFPLIPLYLVSVLHTGAFAVGITEGFAEAISSFLKVISGYVSDKTEKRKPFVLLGYSFSTIIKPLFALATIWPLVVLFRAIERIGKGLRTAPKDTIVAESVEDTFRGKAYGFHRAMDGIGSVLGALLAFFLLPLLGYKKIFVLSAIPGIIAALCILLVREKKSIVPVKENRTPSPKISFRLLPRNLKFLILAASVFYLGQFGYAFILLRAKNIGITDNNVILLYVLFYAVYVIASIPAGVLSDKYGRKPILAGSYLLFALVSFGLIYTTSIKSILPFFAIYGISFAMFDGVQRAFVADFAPKDLMATAIGTFHTAIGLVALPGGYFAGLLWDKVSPEATFIYGFTLSLIATILVLFVKSEKSNTSLPAN